MIKDLGEIWFAIAFITCFTWKWDLKRDSCPILQGNFELEYYSVNVDYFSGL